MIWPVILSGGSGTRLWPMSRLRTPKQLLPIAGTDTMIQATVSRTGDRSRFHAPIIVANAAHRRAIIAQLDAAGIDSGELILEPAGRNTAPAIALAARRVVALDPQGMMLVMPSDHVIGDVPAFHAAIERLTPLVADGWLATFGIRASSPETGYGYIKLGERLAEGVNAVERFVEKPDYDTAQAYVASGGYTWNGGIFLMRADRYLAALARFAPGIDAAVAEAIAGAKLEGRVLRPDAEAFGRCPSDSIDYAVMERDDRVAVAPVDIGWSDIGSWDALFDIAEHDENGNAVRGDAIVVDSHDCLVRSAGPLVSLVGVSGLTVVAEHDSVLIAARGRGQDVKKIVDRLAAADRREHVDAARETHGWGSEMHLMPGVRIVTMDAGASFTAVSARVTLLSGEVSLDGRPLVRGEQVSVEAGQQLSCDADTPSQFLAIRF